MILVPSDVIRLLLIEASTTLRFGLHKLLQRQGYEVFGYGDLDAGLARLEDEFAEGLAGVIIGWPQVQSPSFLALLTRLKGRDCQGLSVMVLAQDAEPIDERLIKARPHTVFTRWGDYADIPRQLTALLAETAQEQARAAKVAVLRVLLVDDSLTARVNYRRLLEAQHYHVTEADSAEQALALAEAQAYDIAIVDYFMPGANGATLCRALRALPNWSDSTLAILTGSYQEAVVSDCLSAGAQEVMFKSESRALFVARVKSLARLRERQLSLAAEKERADHILDAVGDGVYGVDASGRIRFINPAALRLLGMRDGVSPLGQRAQGLIHYADAAGERVAPDACYLHQTYAKGGSLSQWETVFWREDGQALPVECTVSPLYLDAALDGAVVAFRDISERKLAERELTWKLHHDHLTKLLNRLYFEEALTQELTRLKRSHEYSALLFIDLDRFKHLNDTAGHAAGDKLLILIAQNLQSRLRRADLLARLGGDEFAVLLRNVSPLRVMELAETFRAILDETRFVYQGQEFEVSGSVGVTLLSGGGLTPALAMNEADAACQTAKRQGRNCVHLFDAEADAGALTHLETSWSHRLREGLEQQRFSLHFQPIYRLQPLQQAELDGVHWQDHLAAQASEAIGGYEVLLRLNEDEQQLTARAFMTQAERFELLPALDRRALELLAEELIQTDTSGLAFHLNVSPLSLLDPAYRERLFDLCRLGIVARGQLHLELKESAIVTPLAQLLPILEELARLGVMVVLEDFGRGFSALNGLKNLPVGQVKIDGSLIQALAQDAIGQTMVRAIIEVAHTLGRQVIAPLVEDRETLLILKKLGVDYAQGFALSIPGIGAWCWPQPSPANQLS